MSSPVAASLCGVAIALLSLNGYADEIRVTRGACGEPVRLVARDAPLSNVLKRLGESLGFEVMYQSKRDPLITRDERSNAVQLIRDLATSMNFSVEQVADARCSGAIRVVKVSVLLDDGSDLRAQSAKRNGYTPEMESIARQTKLDYLRSHGMEGGEANSTAVKQR